ncbi:MAG: hypothetical protein Q9227_002523 [Pyrenula ochraceoflavens]
MTRGNQRLCGRKILSWKKPELVEIARNLGIPTSRSKKIDLFVRIKEIENEEGLTEKQREQIQKVKFKRGRGRVAGIETRNPTQSPQLPAQLASQRCVVCDEPILAVAQDQITMTCAHTRDVCTECLQQTLEAQLESRGWDRFSCPTCSQPLQHCDMQMWAPPGLFERYDAYLVSKAMESDESIVACAIVTCDGYGICDLGFDSWVTCNKCEHRTCVGCRLEFHPGESCDEHRRRLDTEAQVAERDSEKKEEEAATARFLQEETFKTCPRNSCSAVIEKNGGCDHMTCRKCGEEFCWVCMAPWMNIRLEGNAAHRRDCKYHTDMLNRAALDGRMLPPPLPMPTPVGGGLPPSHRAPRSTRARAADVPLELREE